MSIKSCTLLTTGRTGTDFLQSLLDSHPEVLTFNGHFQFYSFWGESKCVKSGNFALSDFVDFPIYHKYVHHYLLVFVLIL